MNFAECEKIYKEMRALAEQLDAEAKMIDRAGTFEDRLEANSRQGQALGVIMAAEIVLNHQLEQ